MVFLFILPSWCHFIGLWGVSVQRELRDYLMKSPRGNAVPETQGNLPILLLLISSSLFWFYLLCVSPPFPHSWGQINLH